MPAQESISFHDQQRLSPGVQFDHDVIDGAPAARFTQRLKNLVGNGFGLGD